MIAKTTIEAFLSRELDDWSWTKELRREDMLEELDIIAPKFKFKTKPFKHQLACFILGLYNPQFLFFLDMGLGKTKVVLDLLTYYSKYLDKIKRTLILVPSPVNIYGFAEEVKLHSKLSFVELYGARQERWSILERKKADLYILNYAGLQSMIMEEQEVETVESRERMPSKKAILKFRSFFDSIVWDEIHKCFHEDTIIYSTSPKKISGIKINDSVYTLNGIGRVTNVFVNKIPLNEVSKITLCDGRVLFCSRDHRFLTTEDWVRAKDLLCINNTLIFSKVLDTMTNSNQRTGENHEKEIGRFVVRILSRNVYTKIIEKRQRAKILWDKLFCKVANETTRDTEEDIYKAICKEAIDKAEKVYGGASRNKKNALGENESKQPKSKLFNCRKDEEHKKIKWNSECMGWNSWWERALHRATEAIGLFFRLAYGSCCLFNNKASRSSYRLQDRCWEQEAEDWYRGGREEAQYDIAEITRQEERGEVERVGVESVEIYQRGNNDESFKGIIEDKERDQGFVEFYDLEIDSHPSYYANNVLVHNCKNHRTLTYHLCKEISYNYPVRYGLTGTPMGRDAMDLWSQFFLIDHGETLGRTISFYRETFFNARVNHWGGYEFSLDKSKEDTLQKSILNRSIRYDEKEVDDLPERVNRRVKIRMPLEARGYYKSIVEGIILAGGDYKEIEGVFVKLRQICSGFLHHKLDDYENKIAIDFAHNPKLEALMELIEEVPETTKIVVFHEFIHSGDTISKALKKAKLKFVRLYGATKDKKEVLYTFLNDKKTRIFLVNSASGGTGLNLQSVASYVVYYESPVSFIVRRQSEKRVYRTGQTKRTFFYDLVMEDSIEEKILDFIKEGKDIFRAIINGSVKL